MMFEPYSCKKDLVYMAFVPDHHKLVSTTQAYFKEMSVTYEVQSVVCLQCAELCVCVCEFNVHCGSLCQHEVVVAGTASVNAYSNRHFPSKICVIYSLKINCFALY